MEGPASAAGILTGCALDGTKRLQLFEKLIFSVWGFYFNV